MIEFGLRKEAESRKSSGHGRGFILQWLRNVRANPIRAGTTAGKRVHQWDRFKTQRGRSPRLGVAAVAVVLSVSVPVARTTRGDGTHGPAAPGRRADQDALKPYAGLVGGWKNGVGQVERGRARGAWTESAGWAWKLSQDSAALEV